MTGLQSARPLDMRDLVSHVRTFFTAIKRRLPVIAKPAVRRPEAARPILVNGWSHHPGKRQPGCTSLTVSVMAYRIGRTCWSTET
jgi:hypothetical protein